MDDNNSNLPYHFVLGVTINCVSGDQTFVQMVNFLSELLKRCIKLAEKDEFRAEMLFSNEFEDSFPSNERNLNKIDYSQLFVGKCADDVTKIYKDLLDLWMLVQDDLLPGTGREPLDKGQFARTLKLNLHKLQSFAD